MAEFRITIPGEPVAQGRPRFARKGSFVVAYDPPKSRAWKTKAKIAMHSAMGSQTLLDGPLVVQIEAHFTCPKSDYRKIPLPMRPHAKKPDAENVAKCILDAASGVVYRDDSQVSNLYIFKMIALQGEPPHIEMVVKEIA